MKTKDIVIVILSIAVSLMLVAIIGLKRSNSMNEYAIANDCTWYATGSAYGDSRDFVCLPN